MYTDGLLERLKNTGVGCHMGSRFVRVLAYADDITLLVPCKSSLSILIGVCENYAAEYDIMFNGDKSRLLFFKCRSSVMIPSEIMINDQLVGLSGKAVHLGHTVSTTDRDCITIAAKNKFWKCFNMYIANFGQLYCCIKIKLINQFGCSFYGSPLWYLNGAAVQSLCIDWRKSLRSLWGVHPTTHCNVITALSNQVLLISTLQNRCIRFMSKCLSSSNCILKLISQFAISNPMSAVGKNYRSLKDDDGECSNRSSLMKWTISSKAIKNTVSTIRELIDVRDGYKECIGFSWQELNIFMQDLCTG